ncbi:MAG: hypothetical protein IT578_03670 [Verrucomicrobiae bacterium]|nr:hypothetical protein [Verrucomicrobiae bacterium]
MNSPPTLPLQKPDFNRFGAWPATFLALGVLGAAACLFGATLNPTRAAFAWHFAFIYGFTLCAGALFWTLLHHATDSGWSVIPRRLAENLASLFPWIALAFVPVALAGVRLFSWMGVDPSGDPVLHGKAAYLNAPFFYGRAAVYFLAFIFFGSLLRRLSVRQDLSGAPGLSLTMRKLSYAGIPIFAMALTFGSFDWLMGLDYRWFSTMWGVYIFSGSALSAMALMVVVTRWLQAKGWLKEITVEHYHLMGKLLLAFVIFWAYIAFSQYFLIWYANIPEETFFFLHRSSGSWKWLSGLLIFGQFLVPFVLLLLQWTKKRVNVLTGVSVWLLLMHAVDLYWIILPQSQFGGSRAEYDALKGVLPGVQFHWMDFAALAAVLGFLFYAFLRRLASASLIPVRDPRLEESLHCHN